MSTCHAVCRNPGYSRLSFHPLKLPKQRGGDITKVYSKVARMVVSKQSAHLGVDQFLQISRRQLVSFTSLGHANYSSLAIHCVSQPAVVSTRVALPCRQRKKLHESSTFFQACTKQTTRKRRHVHTDRRNISKNDRQANLTILCCTKIWALNFSLHFR